MYEEASFRNIKDWKNGFIIGADIGGSGIRVQLINFDNTADVIELPRVKVDSSKKLISIIDNIKQNIRKINSYIKCYGSAFAIAGLRRGNTVWVQNWSGSVEDATIDFDKLDPQMFPPNCSCLLNDLEAGAYGLIAISKKSNIEKYFTKLWGPKDSMCIHNVENSAVFAIGSGLGGAIIVQKPEPIVYPLEPGFLIAAQNVMNFEDQTYNEIFSKVSEHYYKSEKVPVYEDFASGRGISLIYKILTNSNELIDAERIVSQSKNGDEKALKAMEISYIYFARLIKQVITAFNCKSALMALANQSTNYWFVDKIKSKLEKEIMDSPCKEIVIQCGVYTQTEDCNFNLLGASYMAIRCAKQKT